MASPELTEQPRIPTTGMRGGLGRTLLTAFLVLAIVPLSALSWYATRRERRDIQREVTAKLSSVATMMEAQVLQWAEARAGNLAVLAAVPPVQENIATLTSDSSSRTDAAREALRAQLQGVLRQDLAFQHLALLDGEGHVLASAGSCGSCERDLIDESLRFDDADFRVITLDPTAEAGAVIRQPLVGPDGRETGLLVGWLGLSELTSDLAEAGDLDGQSDVYLVDPEGVALPQGRLVDSAGIEAALGGEEAEGLYENYAGVPVIGVYRRIPELGLVLVAEQAQATSFASADAVTAAIVGATLLVALATAIIAAVVTRQITRPVVKLTGTALSIAQGDLDQRVPIDAFAKDEIGILAHVFNRMASELKSLYEDLEAKVAQRTALLQKANYQIQRRAIQLAATVEVSQAATSILDPSRLLREVVRLVHDRFDYSYVGVYLLDEAGEWARLREGKGGGADLEKFKADPVPIEEGSAVGEAVLTGDPRIVQWSAERAEETLGLPYIRVEAALPLKMGGQVIGVLNILDTETDELDDDAVSVLQNVANQIAIALENARIYKKEKETARRLRKTEEFRSRFLAHMSHELREPLTNIIGFSRLILKGLDGPISDQQRKDLQIIYANSQHLLGLINDLLDISQIEAGLVELHFQELDLADVIKSVMSTASALVRDKDVELQQDIASDLPLVEADATRIRQVLLRLLTNAAKFTEQGRIKVEAWPDNGRVLVGVSDTGAGIAPQDQDRIFDRFEQGTMEGGRRPKGAGLGLALSKEFVEMHGGEIWVESELGEGSTFTFALPLENSPEQQRETSDEATGAD